VTQEKHLVVENSNPFDPVLALWVLYIPITKKLSFAIGPEANLLGTSSKVKN